MQKNNPIVEARWFELAQVAREHLRFEEIEAADAVELHDSHHPVDELVTTLLYRVSHYSYRQILRAVESWPEQVKNEIIELSVRRRGPYDELLREFHSGYAFVFDILMDIGGWRDLHRHRRCQQIPQEFTTAHGYELPREFEQAGLRARVREIFDDVLCEVDALHDLPETTRAYLLPFAGRIRCLFKMDFAEAEYIFTTAHRRERSCFLSPYRMAHEGVLGRALSLSGRPDYSHTPGCRRHPHPIRNFELEGG